MIPGDERRGFLMSMTLTELALLLFFLLLFTAVWQISRAEAENARLQSEQARLDTIEAERRGLEELIAGKYASTDSEGFRDTLRAAAKKIGALVENDSLRAAANRAERERDSARVALQSTQDSADELRERATELKATIDGMPLLMEERARLNEEEFRELLRAAREQPATREADRLREELKQASDATATCSDDYADLRGQFTFCQNQMRGNGLDHPPCWADSETGRPEYIFTVVMGEATFSVLPAWPPHREDDFYEVAGANDLLGAGWDSGEFSRRAQPILDWSKMREPECRHFVRIDDSAELSKGAFKENLLRIENYFYKYLPRGDRGFVPVQ